MNIMAIVITAFLFLETMNVLALYFFPDSKYANSLGVFKAWEKSKSDPDMHNLLKYLVNWVAGTKLIFILVLIAVLLTAEDQDLSLIGIALVLSISAFFWRMFPLMRNMDRRGQLDPENYSTVLGWMIFSILVLFLAAVLASLII